MGAAQLVVNWGAMIDGDGSMLVGRLVDDNGNSLCEQDQQLYLCHTLNNLDEVFGGGGRLLSPFSIEEKMSVWYFVMD